MTATVRRTWPRATVVLGFAAGAAVVLAVAVLALTATDGPLTAPRAGDLMAERLNLGYFNLLLLFAGLISLVGLAYRYLQLNAVAAFWMAYVLTRPLGASIGDLLSQARADGGLGWGTSATSYAFLAAILVLVVMTRSQRVEPEGEALAP